MARSSHRTSKGSRGNPFVTAVAALVVLAALYYVNERNRPGGSDAFRLPGESSAPSAPSVDRGPATTEKSRGFDLLHGGFLVEARNNDGDSFVIRHGEQTHEIRLYFVDCPEKYRHHSNGKRLAEQGAYFGGLDEKETIRAGEKARDFTLGLLRQCAFTVHTKWEKVYDSGRHYAFVRVRDAEGTEAYLHELLVARGLARIHTKGIDLPDGTPWRTQKARLKDLEKAARAAKLGAWAP